jgi:DNA invertase Pin-like site-specific DNA recombinase
MKRVWCLYRVSTKGQVNPDEDIPMQKNACHKFIESHPDWKLDRELYEKGVSGWKNKTDDRDELVKIKKAAEQKQFDVLLVFMFDRLGRREDESPLVVQYLVSHGVEVWSVNEGERKIEGHTDLLINYITFWQSSGESKKTSIRVKEILGQMNERSEYTGSNPPYGYEVYDTGVKHWKYDKNVKDLRISETESEVVKLMYDMYVQKGFGVGRITNYLNSNGYTTRKQNAWRINTVFSILKNPIYYGRKRFNTKDSSNQGKNLPSSEWKLGEYRDDWKIIDEDVFNQVQETMFNRASKQSKTVRKGKLLLNGFARCGYCRNLLNSDTGSNSYTLKDGTKKKRQLHRYRCFTQRQSTIPHDRHTFTSHKYEDEVIEIIKDKLRSIKLNQNLLEKSASYKKENHNVLLKEINSIKKTIQSKTNELEVLNNEIVKSLMGQSKFKPEQLSVAIENLESQLEQMNGQLTEKEKNYHSLDKEVEKEIDFIQNVDKWIEDLDSVDHDKKKVMIGNLVKEIYFYKDSVDVELKLNLL